MNHHKNNVNSTTETEIVTKNGVTDFVKKIRIVETYRSLSRKSKIALGVYGCGMAMYNVVSTYNAGKASLLQYREQSNPDGRNTRARISEWDAVREGCKKDSAGRFGASIVWPISVTSQTMPYIVLQLNQPSLPDKP